MLGIHCWPLMSLLVGQSVMLCAWPGEDRPDWACRVARQPSRCLTRLFPQRVCCSGKHDSISTAAHHAFHTDGHSCSSACFLATLPLQQQPCCRLAHMGRKSSILSFVTVVPKEGRQSPAGGKRKASEDLDRRRKLQKVLGDGADGKAEKHRCFTCTSD